MSRKYSSPLSFRIAHNPLLVTARLTAALVLACLLLGSGATAAPPLATVPPTSANAYAVSVTGPDGSGLAGSQGGGCM